MIDSKVFMENQVLLFEKGIKPCFFFGSTKRVSRQLKAKKYPFIYTVGTIYSQILFFQNETAKQTFMDKYALKLPIMPLNHAIIGEALGYPPIAYNAFPIDSTESCGIFYHGISFGCKEQDVEDCLRYMHEHYPIPLELQIGLEIIYPKRSKKIAQ